jgi:MFS family permease
VTSSPAPRPSYRSVFAVAEFRVLWLSYVLSAGGDRLALVAMTLLVYARTKSPFLAAVTFASGFVPYLIGGLFLSGLADRLPRRTVMVACDAARALLVGAMLVPRLSLGVLIALLYLVTVLQPPFDAARSAIVRDMMDAPRYPLAMAVLQSTSRTVMVAGAALGGLLVALFGARPALAADGFTFVASGLLILFGVRARAAAAPAGGAGGESPLAQLAGGVRLVFGDPALRTLIGLAWLAAFFSQLGAAVASPIFIKKIGPLTRLKWMGPMTVLTCGILAVTILRPNLEISMAIFALSNTFAMYQIAANTAFVERIPNERRAQAFGLANAGLIVGQGVAFAIAGAAAEVVPPSTVVALSGGLGALIACGLALRWRRMSPAVGRHTARHLGREDSLTRQTLVRAARSN